MSIEETWKDTNSGLDKTENAEEQVAGLQQLPVQNKFGTCSFVREAASHS